MPAQLTVDGKGFELPTLVGTENEKAIDIRQLRSQSGYVTLDQGYMNTGSTTSAITFIDGDKGILRYRGIPIEELAEKSTFTETAYLLIYGKLPNKTELERWRTLLTRHSLIHEDMKRFFDGYPSTAHPMAVLSAMICSLSSYYPESLDVRNKEMNDINIARLIAKVRTIAAYSFKKSIGQPFVYPEELAQLLRQLPQHDVLGPGRAVRDRRGHRQGAQPALHPARRSRAELLDLDGADGGQRAGERIRQRGRRASVRSGGPCTAGPTRRSSRCWRPSSGTAAGPRSSSSWPNARTRASG